MNPYRLALLGGLVYGLPLGLWLLGGFAPGADGQGLTSTMAILPLVQIAALTMLLPALSADAGGLGAALLLVALPWPLLAVGFRAGVAPWPLLAGQGLVLAAALVLVPLAGGLDRLDRAGLGLVGGLQVAALIALVTAAPLLLRLGGG